jgi:hypothetical protein
MNADQILRDTFVDHEHLTPDADETLRRVHDEIGRRTGVTHLGSRRRPFVVVATGIGVAATIVGIVAASVIFKSDDRPTGPTQPATQSTQPVPSGTSSLGSHTGPVTAASVEYLTVAAGYLPPGTVTQVLGENGSFGELRNYVVTGGTSTKVDLTSAPSVAALPGTTTFTGPGTSLKVAGHVARQWAKTGLSRVIVNRSGGVTAVDVTRTAMPASAIAALARTIAGGLRYDRHDALKPEFRLGYVPAGSVIAELAVDNQRTTTWLLGRTAAGGSAPLGANTNVYSTDAPPVLRGAAGRKVQGHVTRTGTKDGVPVLEIVGAVGRHTIVISGGPGAMNLSGLYKIGDGLILG